MSFMKCKRNVMGHYTTKPMLLIHGRLNMEVEFGRLDSRSVFAGWYGVYATYRYLLYMYADLEGLESHVKSYLL